MILDTSAVIAILRFETEASEFAKIIERAVQRRISAVSYVEAGAVIDGSKDPVASRRFDELIEAAQIAIEPVTEAQARIARPRVKDAAAGSFPHHAAHVAPRQLAMAWWQGGRQSGRNRPGKISRPHR
jgi:ribonuclease VapC